jgi:GAF domain-containing protein
LYLSYGALSTGVVLSVTFWYHLFGYGVIPLEAAMNESTSHLIRFLQQENTRLSEENAGLHEQVEALQQYLIAVEELHWAAQRITSELNLIILLDEILYDAMHLAKAQDGSVLLLDEEKNELVFAVVHGDIEGELRGFRIPAGTGIAGWVASEAKSAVVNNPRQDWRFSPLVDELFGFVTRSIICVPMSTQDKTVGVINLLNKQEDAPFVEADAALLSILAHVAAVALEAMRERIEAEDAAEAAEPVSG